MSTAVEEPTEMVDYTAHVVTDVGSAIYHTTWDNPAEVEAEALGTNTGVKYIRVYEGRHEAKVVQMLKPVREWISEEHAAFLERIRLRKEGEKKAKGEAVG